jgi:hypothetical protein
MFVSKNRELLMELRAKIDKLETVLVVMDPKVSTSADAYDGLRKQIAMAASSRQAHLVQLAQFSRALKRGATTDKLTELVEEWMQQAGLVAVMDPNPDLYEILDGEPEAGRLEISAPAYVDPQTGVLVAQGQARWAPRSVAEARSTAAENPHDSTEQNDTPEEAIA